MRTENELRVNQSALGDRPSWRKSSASGSGNCVEVAFVDSGILVRNSRDPQGPVAKFSPVGWDAFLSGIHRGEFDVISAR
ncbi:MAG: DUF397 domain-containing protein [Frankia sp.]